MKKCIRCGKMISDDIKICDECAFDFDEYQQYRHLYDTKEDPIVPENKQTDLTDTPIFTFVFGIISLIFMLLFLFTPGITIFYFVGVLILACIAYYFSVKPAKVKLLPFQTIGKWMANIAVSITIFKLVFFLIGKIL